LAEPDSEQPDADFSQNLNLDQLLEQVGDLTQRAQNLVNNTETPRKPKPIEIDKIKPTSLTEVNSNHSTLLDNLDKQKPKHSSLLDNLGKTKSDNSEKSKDKLSNESEEDIFKFDNIDDLMEPPIDKSDLDELDMETENIDVNNLDESYKGSSHELDIDPQIQELAEDEINQIYTKLSPEFFENELDNEENYENANPDFDIDMVTIPPLCKNIMTILFIVNSPFIWLPNSIRNGLGYFSLATLIFGLSLWAMLILKH
jgi:hypothetical protein